MIAKIRSTLLTMQDVSYKEFQSRLMPTVPRDTVIGVRTPQLRELSRKIKNEKNICEFLECLPHRYYEENNLHAFLIEQISDFDICVAELDRFLPYVDNWATCDMLRPKCFHRRKADLAAHIETWLGSNAVYTVRFGIGMLLTHFLDEDFDDKYLEKVAAISSQEYYINTMIAWYFATALAKQYKSAVVYFEKNRLPVWVHNKTIQKAIESYRITAIQKTYLRSLKRKL